MTSKPGNIDVIVTSESEVKIQIQTFDGRSNISITLDVAQTEEVVGLLRKAVDEARRQAATLLSEGPR